MQGNTTPAEQFAASLEVDRVIAGAAVRRAALQSNESPISQMREVVRHEALGRTQQRRQLSHRSIATRQLDEQPPPNRVARESQERWQPGHRVACPAGDAHSTTVSPILT